MRVNEKKKWIYQIVFAIILYTVTYAIVFKQMHIEWSDYYLHAADADEIPLGSILSYVMSGHLYCMWHMLVKVTSRVLCMPMEYAAANITALTNVVVYFFVMKVMMSYHVVKSEVMSFLLLLLGPVYIPWYNPELYLGQGTPNTWHNPTNLMVKSFAICCFFMVFGLLDAIDKQKEIKRSQYVTLTVVIFLSVLAKPAFAQGFIPGLGVYLAILCAKKRSWVYIKKYFYICLTFIPGVLWMMCQFVVYFYTGTSGEGVGIGWLEVSSSPNVCISLMLLFGFPLLYLLFSIKRVYKETDIQLSICYEVMAWLERALLYEKGGRKYHGNFGWGSLLSAFVLWMVVVMHFINDVKEMKMNDKYEVIKNSILLVVLLLHLLCGCYYIFCLLFVEGMIW